MKVYKVVTVLPINGRPMVSCRTSAVKPFTSPAVLTYEIGKVTIPYFGLIFCFRSKRDAIKFAREYKEESTIKILVGVGVPARKSIVPRTIHISCDIDDMIDLWKGTGYYNVAGPAPNGTVLMRTFRPLKEVKINWED